MLGAIAGTGIALFFPLDLSVAYLPLIIVIGFVAGAGLGIFCAILYSKLNVNLVISTLMCNYIVLNLLEYLVYGPWQKPGLGFPYTAEFPLSARMPVWPGTSVHYPTLFVGICSAILAYILLKKTKLGYEIRVFGENPKAAKHAGIDELKISVRAMVLSGGLAGLSGVGEITGVHHMLKVGIDGAGRTYAISYGYIAVIIAWLAKNNPLGCMLVAPFIAGILSGGYYLQIIGLPQGLVSTLLGLMLLGLVGGAFLTRYRIKLVR
jgi:simple sugar transport system permease protein